MNNYRVRLRGMNGRGTADNIVEAETAKQALDFAFTDSWLSDPVGFYDKIKVEPIKGLLSSFVFKDENGEEVNLGTKTAKTSEEKADKTDFTNWRGETVNRQDIQG